MAAAGSAWSSVDVTSHVVAPGHSTKSNGLGRRGYDESYDVLIEASLLCGQLDYIIIT